MQAIATFLDQRLKVRVNVSKSAVASISSADSWSSEIFRHLASSLLGPLVSLPERAWETWRPLRMPSLVESLGRG